MGRVRALRVALAAIVVCSGFSNQGCIRSAGGQLVEGGLEAGKEWALKAFQNSLPTIEAKVTALVEAKLAEQEARHNAEFDARLAKVAPDDPVTGGKAARTWRDFDLDKTGHLEPVEIARLTAYIMAEGPKRVAEGAMTKEEWNLTQKDALKGGGAAAAVATALVLLRRRKKAKEAEAARSAPGPDPKPPAPPTPSSSPTAAG